MPYNFAAKRTFFFSGTIFSCQKLKKTQKLPIYIIDTSQFSKTIIMKPRCCICQTSALSRTPCGTIIIK